MKQMRYIWTILLVAAAMTAQADNYYVATNGSDAASGLIGAPFATITKAITVVSAGDTVFIRGGSYHEAVVMNNVDGALGSPITISNYNDEQVTLDGTEDISGFSSGWTQHSGNIYKTTLTKDVWQLFVDGRMQITARWPNASTHPTDPVTRKPNSWKAEDGSWWSKDTTWGFADMPGTSVAGTVENNPAYHDLAATGLSFQGGSAILAMISQGPGNGERLITSHSAGSSTFTHAPLDDSETGKGYSSSRTYIIEHLNALDQAEEWYYIPADKTLYLWADDGQNPTGRAIRGRTQVRAFDMVECDYVTIRGLNFFAANFRTDFAKTSTNIRVEDCNLSCPDASQRLLGIYPFNPDTSDYQTSLRGNNNALINCVMEYSECGAIQFFGDGTELHNNLFHHTTMLGIGYTASIMQVNKFTRNTVYICGSRAAVKTNAGPQENRIQTHNLIDGIGFQQVQTDGTGLQCNSATSTGTIRAYNWFLNADCYGTRWDGHTGLQGQNHHQVGYRVNGAMQVKGDNHDTHNNTCLEDLTKNGVIILAETTENQNSRTWNNLSDKIAGHRDGPLSLWPIHGTHGNNWNGYVTGTAAKDQLRDADNLDFRPKAGSDVIDAGLVIAGITDGYLGAAPDIGAYEFGESNYWIPGRQIDKAATAIPPNGSTAVRLDADLMWLEGKDAISHDVYFGTTPNPTFQGNQANNIFTPGALTDHQTYYWRIDTVTPTGTITGDLWSFTAQVPPVIVNVDINPIADTYVRSDQAANNFGTSTTLSLATHTDGSEREGYLKFDINVPGTIVSATLNLYGTGASTAGGVQVYSMTDTSWDEMTMTYNNRALIDGVLLDQQDIPSLTYKAFNVSSAVTGNGIIAFGLDRALATSYRAVGSGDDPANPPVLSISYTPGAPPVETPYESWGAGYGLTGSETNYLAHSDTDALNQLVEYGFGGNPTNDDASAILPTFGNVAGTNVMEYVYRRRTDRVARGLDYYLEECSNLISNDWNIVVNPETGTAPLETGFEAVTNRISTEAKTNQFIRLRISID